jgi:hypothetical protein
MTTEHWLWAETIIILITIKLLDFVHRPDFYKQKTQRFGNWICFRLQARGGGAPTLQKNKKLAFPQAMPEQNHPIRNTFNEALLIKIGSHPR